MISVQVFYKESGKAAKGAAVCVGFDGIFRGITSKEYTDSDGNVHFDADPGSGKVFVNGKTAYEGRISGRTIIYI